MNIKEAIFTRKSCRSFLKKDVEKDTIEKIQLYIEQDVKPLFPNIRTCIRIEDKKNVHCFLPYAPNQFITVYSEKKDNYGINVGFMLQHIELYLHTLGLGACWLGMAKSNAKVENLSFVICIAFGYPKHELNRDISQFKRKDWNELSDCMDSKLETARLAPSSMNSQPWFFTHEKDEIHLWYVPQRGPFKSIKLKPNVLNQIDLGIVIAHICIGNEKVMVFKSKDKHYLNYQYIMSFK